MDKEFKKYKLIYSGELIFFAVVFLVLGFLELFAVFKLSKTAQLIFKIVTLCGATWLTADFIWTLKSPKRRAKNGLLDKAMLLPLALYLYVFDILGFVLNPEYGYYQVGVPIAFMYIACAYIFQGIYHYFNPLPIITEMVEEAKKEAEEKAALEAEKQEQPVEEIEKEKEE